MPQVKMESNRRTLASVKKEMNPPRITKSARSAERAEALLETHQLHLGLFKRISTRLGVDPSYVSKVAGGTRKSETVMRILLNELAELR